MMKTMPHPFCIAGMLLLVAILAGCNSPSLPTRNYTATPSPPPPVTIPLAPKENGGVKVTVRSVARSVDPGYQLKHAGYIQFAVVVQNTTSVPIQVSGAQLTAGGSTDESLYAGNIVPIQTNTTGLTAVGIGGAVAGIPLAGTVAYFASTIFSNIDNSARSSLDDAMLKHGTVSPGTSATGLVVFRDKERSPETFIVNYFTGGLFSMDMQSVIVPLQQQEVAATITQ